MRILVAEDHELNQRLIEIMLSEMTHEFEIVDNGALAVDAVQEKDFDLVLMDIRMPVMDGFEATKLIRGLESEKGEVPIIALTAEADDIRNHERYKSAGMSGTLAKPLSLAGLMQTLAQYDG